MSEVSRKEPKNEGKKVCKCSSERERERGRERERE
jgi:hypothetical protein